MKQFDVIRTKLSKKARRSSRIIATTLMIIVLYVCISLPSVGQSNTQTWSTPQLIGDGWWNSMAIDSEGNLHISWYYSPSFGDGLSHDTLGYIRRDYDGEWSPVVDAIYTGDGGFTVRSALATTSDGFVYAAFRGVTQHYVAKAPIINALNASTWSSWSDVGTESGYYIDMISTPDDVLHVVFSGRPALAEESAPTPALGREALDCALCFDLFYTRSTDGGQTWSSLTPISTLTGSGSDRVQIQRGESGRLYITWDEGVDWYSGSGAPLDVRMSYSEDNGLTWSPPIIMDGGDPTSPKAPIFSTLTELRDGSIMFVWMPSVNTDRNIYYQISTDVGQTWSQPTAIPGIFNRGANEGLLDHFSMITDQLGLVHLFAIGRDSLEDRLNSQLYEIIYVPSSQYWMPPRRLFYSNTERPEWPEAILGLSNDIHLTWFVREIDESAGGVAAQTQGLKVYYSHLSGNLSPRPTVEFRPTPTLLPTPTVFQNIEPSPTMVPTADSPRNMSVVSADNYASEVFLGGLAVTALVCGFVFAIVRFRRY